MSHWELLAYVGVVSLGVLSFLRVVANEIAIRAADIEQHVRAEAARRREPGPEPQAHEIVAAKAA